MMRDIAANREFTVRRSSSRFVTWFCALCLFFACGLAQAALSNPLASSSSEEKVDSAELKRSLDQVIQSLETTASAAT